MKQNVVETLIGLAVALGAALFLVFALTQGGQTSAGRGYVLQAAFNKAEGIAPGADVRVAGVKVGQVVKVELDRESFKAVATLAIAKDVKLPEDSIAQVAADGFLGGSFIAIEPGPSEDFLAPNSKFSYTKGSVDMADLIGELIGRLVDAADKNANAKGADQ